MAHRDCMTPSAFGVMRSAGGVECYSMGHWWGDSTLRFVDISGSHGMGETWFLKGKERYAYLKKGERNIRWTNNL